MQAAAAADAGPVARAKALDDSLARAHQLAVSQGHGTVSLEHLLFSLQDDPDAQFILDTSGVQRDRLSADVSAYVGRLSETTPTDASAAPKPGADLLRILQLATMAARQSQRRQMDGAIVLAAIIGDGNSPSAGMLKAQGLTFDAVIKAISLAAPPRVAEVAAPAPPRAHLPPPEPAAPAPRDHPAARISRVPEAPSADDMLANARARVKQAEPQTVPIRTKKAEPTQVPPPETPAPAVEPAQAIVNAPPLAPTAPMPAQPAPLAEPVAPPQPQPPVAATRPSAPIPPIATAPPATVPHRPSAPGLAELRRPAPHNAAHLPPLPPPSSVAGLAPPPPPGAGTMPVPVPTPSSNIAPPPTPAPMPSGAFSPPMPIPVVAMPPPPAQPPPPAGGPLAFSPTPPAMQQMPPPMAAPVPQAFNPPSLPPQALAPAQALDIVGAAAGLPASLRLGTPVLVEVRIPRDQIDVPRRRAPGLPAQADLPIYRVVSVRLGTGGVSGLAIEPRSPETVWLGMGRDLDGQDVIWQFVVTPTRRGRFAVNLSVAGRTLSPYGVAGDGTPQSETFAVVVKPVRGNRLKRFAVGLALFGCGAATAAFAGGPILALAKGLLTQILK